MSPRGKNLKNEASIVWEEDPSGLEYVRVCNRPCHARRRIARWDGPGRRIGYATLKPSTPSDRDPLGGGRTGIFTRRVFFLQDHDRDSDPGGVYRTGAPVEAKDPRTILPGADGEQNSRAWGGKWPRS